MRSDNRLIQTCGILSVLLAVTGCVHYHPRPLAAETSLASFQSRTLDGADLAVFIRANHEVAEWPPKRWDVKTLTLASFFFNPDLDVARADWAVARAGLVTAGERPNPDVSVVPGYNSSTPASLMTPWILTLNLDFTIETAGKRGHRQTQARHLSEASRLAIASAAWQVRSRVRGSLLALYSATESIAQFEKQLELQEQTVALLRRQFDAGAISPFELTQARIALGTMRLSLHDAIRQQGEARAQLASALGVAVGALDGVPFDFDEFRQVPAELPAADVQRQALLNRADVLGLLAEYAASQAALQLEVAKQYPDIHLGPGYEMDQSDNKWTLGISAPLPLFNRNRGPIAQAEARRTQAAARFMAGQAHALAEIERALAAYRGAVEKAATTETMMKELERQERAARQLFEAGEISKLELGLIQLLLAASHRARLDALVSVHEALGLLEDAVQRPADIAGWVTTTPPRGEAPAKR
jgi:outer membrane protein TolC